MSKAGYRLTMAGGLEWQILAGKGSQWLCDLLARMTRLPAGTVRRGRTLIFVPRAADVSFERVLADRGFAASAGVLPGSEWSHEGLGLIDFWSHPGIPYVFGLIDNRRDHQLDLLQVQQALYPAIRTAITSGGLLVHTALIERDGEGVLIVAAGNTGKSTCCVRVPLPWRALSDDEALIVPASAGRYAVHPLPTWSEHFWKKSDLTWDLGQASRLAAILFLKQSQTDYIAPVGKGIASLSLYKSAADASGKYTMQLSQDRAREMREKMLDNACQVANAVPTFELQASLTGQFWVEIEKVLGGD